MMIAVSAILNFRESLYFCGLTPKTKKDDQNGSRCYNDADIGLEEEDEVVVKHHGVKSKKTILLSSTIDKISYVGAMFSPPSTYYVVDEYHFSPIMNGGASSACSTFLLL